MPEERRRNEDIRLDRMMEFILESREYRAADVVRQEYLRNKVDSIESEAKKTNGRLNNLEDWQKEVTVKVQDRKEVKKNDVSLLTLVCTVIMAISAAVMFFKK